MKTLESPRAVWLMVPAAAVDATINELLPHLTAGDIIIDGGNSYYVDDIRRAREWPRKASTMSTSGPAAASGDRTRLLPDDRRRGSGRGASRFDLRAACPRRRGHPPHAGRESVGGTAERGYLHCGPNGAGPLREDGPQRDRRRTHGRVRRGFQHPSLGQHRQARPRGRCRDDAAARSRTLSVRLQSARRCRGVATRKRGGLVAPRPYGRGAEQGPGAQGLRGARVGFRRGTVDDQGRDRRGGARARAVLRALRALQLARRGGFRRQALSAMRYEFGGHLEKLLE